jgi:hypothetical protein
VPVNVLSGLRSYWLCVSATWALRRPCFPPRPRWGCSAFRLSRSIPRNFNALNRDVLDFDCLERLSAIKMDCN